MDIEKEINELTYNSIWNSTWSPCQMTINTKMTWAFEITITRSIPNTVGAMAIRDIDSFIKERCKEYEYTIFDKNT